MKNLFLIGLVAVAIVGCNCKPADCQSLDAELAAPAVSAAVQADAIFEASSGFHHELIKAAQLAAKEGKISRLDVLRLRASLLSPAMRDRVEDLCITQMRASGENQELIPLNPDGSVDRASIDWEGLTAFLKEMMPFILMLIKLFSGMGAVNLFRRFKSVSVC